MANSLVSNLRRERWRGIAMISLLAFAAVNTFLRAASLGYSNFQGDEVAAQDYLFGNQGILQFLLTRSKGPLQYLLTYGVNGIVLGKVDHPEGFLRVPFLLAGILSVVAIYLLGARYWSRRSGLIAAFLLAGSGLFLAFSRVAQYQSFVVLLSILTYCEFLGHLEDGATRRLVSAGILSGVALLFHYDALSFILPIALYLATQRIRSERSWTSLLLYLVPLALVSAVFYIPYILDPEFPSTVSYLLGQRITSEFRYDSLYYSLRLLTIYHSKEFLILLFLGLLLFAGTRMRNGGRVVGMLVVLLTGLVVGRILHVERVGWLVYTSSLVGAAMAGRLLLWGRPDSSRGRADVALNLWLLISFTAYGLWFAMPLSHIYTFLTPLFIGLGVALEPALDRYPGISLAILLTAGLSATSFNYQAFVNATPEYPWNSKTYVFGRMSEALSKGEAIEGIFGFPYNRNWREIGSKVGDLGVSTYSSNEKFRLTKYYLRVYTWDENDYQVYIWVDRPQSLSRQERPPQAPLIEGPNYAIFGR